MPRLIWSPTALQDLARLHAFLKPKDPGAARRAIKEIRRSVTVLKRHPEVGNLVDEMPPVFREWIIPFGRSAYIALYHHDHAAVLILAVRHAREAGYD